MQVILDKKEKEQLVVKLYQEGKPIREIAQQAHLSFGTIGKIIRRINGRDEYETVPNDMSIKAKKLRPCFYSNKASVPLMLPLN
jgi:uncharacterized protein YerC